MSKNEDIEWFKGRGGITEKAGRLTEGLLACHEPGPIRMPLAKDRDIAEIGAMNMGCFDLNGDDRVEIVDCLPRNDEPPLRKSVTPPEDLHLDSQRRNQARLIPAEHCQ
ncbi:hypothetical protein [Bradyrhizobium sp. SZCCHNR3118]|uniref:hypothetical protein n=1 Tax=Bradyrhizobium sp. SZCCHNR3118 TaxID=3057468 RepID=UPI002916DE18|nr:hypothetical protein [Bradyrhizobium sp. SZCCHNR3118]